jgi:hypothetical protein
MKISFAALWLLFPLSGVSSALNPAFVQSALDGKSKPGLSAPGDKQGTLSDDSVKEMLKDRMKTGSYDQNQLQTWDARVRNVSGDVRVRASESGEWTPLEGEMPLYSSDFVRTGNGQAEITLDDKGLLILDRNSELELPVLTKNNAVLSLNSGGISAKVLHFLDEKLKFQIRTPPAVCEIRGTEFAVEYSRLNKTSGAAVFDEGSLTVTPLGAKGEPQGEYTVARNSEMTIAPGQKRFRSVPLSRMSRYRSALSGIRGRLALLAKTWKPLTAEKKEEMRARVFKKAGSALNKSGRNPAKKTKRRPRVKTNIPRRVVMPR